jgi:hypothetical protein
MAMKSSWLPRLGVLLGIGAIVVAVFAYRAAREPIGSGFTDRIAAIVRDHREGRGKREWSLAEMDPSVRAARIVAEPFSSLAMCLFLDLDPGFLRGGARILGERDWLIAVERDDGKHYEWLQPGEEFSLIVDDSPRAGITGIELDDPGGFRNNSPIPVRVHFGSP